MKYIDSLPNVEIEDIDYTDCEKNGIYIIKGKLKDGNLDNYSNVEIPFGSPDSTGLCDIIVHGNEVTMKCNNKEKFDISSVVFEPQVIKNYDNQDIFKLGSYYYLKRFSCAMSYNSEIPDNDVVTVYNEPTKKKSHGLSGGIIALMVICFIVCIAIIIMIFLRNRKICKPKNIDCTNRSESVSVGLAIERN